MTKNIGYYYCSVETLLSILQNNQIYASDPLKMNDSDELIWFAKNFSLFSRNVDLIKHIGYSVSIEEIERQLLTNGQDNLFVTCFSRLSDELSQWRGYGDDGRGVAIGFDLSAFTEMMDYSYVYDVKYRVPLPREVLEYFSDFIGVCQAEEGNINEKMIQSAFLDMMILYMARYKNRTFKAENEIRLMFEKREWDYKLILNGPRKRMISKPNFETNFRLTNNKLDIIEYAKIEIPNRGITEIKIGPKSILKQSDIKHISERCLGYRIAVSNSTLSYR